MSDGEDMSSLFLDKNYVEKVFRFALPSFLNEEQQEQQPQEEQQKEQQKEEEEEEEEKEKEKEGVVVEQKALYLETACTDYDLTGQILWPGSSCLCHYLVSTFGKDLRGKKVVELGAGVGLVSLLACRYGPKSIHSTDGNEIVIENLEENLVTYKLSPFSSPSCCVPSSPSFSSSSSSPSSSSSSLPLVPHQVSLLEWGAEEAEEFLEKKENNEPFGVVLIADCAYCVQATQKLIKTAERLLVKGGKCLIAHKSRWGVVDEALVTAFQENGFDVVEMEVAKVVAKNYPPDEQDGGKFGVDNSKTTMHLFKLTKK